MEQLIGVDWHDFLIPSLPVGATIFRATLVYLALFFVLRFTLSRASGTLGAADLLLVVLLAHAADRALTHEYMSVMDGTILVATIIIWHYAINWLAYRVPLLERLVRQPPLPLVKNGQLLRRNMRQELITEDELMSQVRLQGVSDLSEVAEVHVESDGRISVLTREDVNKSTPVRSKT